MSSYLTTKYKLNDILIKIKKLKKILFVVDYILVSLSIC